MFKVILQEFYSNLVILCRGVTLEHVIFTILRRVFLRVEGCGEGGFEYDQGYQFITKDQKSFDFFLLLA